MEHNKSHVKIENKPIKGMSIQTFVKGYRGQSQMDTNTISGIKLSAHGNRIMQRIYKAFEKRDK